MKKILIATDFTPAANNAARYGVNMAKHISAEVYLFHAYHYPLTSAGVLIPGSDFNSERYATELLEAQATQLQQDFDINMKCICTEGSGAEAIVEFATANKVDMIICGMKANAKSLKKVFGSVGYSLLKKSAIPMLIIPEGVAFKKPAHMALALDMDPNTSPTTLNLMRELSETFFSKVSVLQVVSEDFNEADILKFHPPISTSEIRHLHPVYEFPIGDNIAKTIKAFAESRLIDMLVVIPHKKSLAERLFTESISRNLVFYSNVPILALPQKQVGVDDADDRMEEIRKGYWILDAGVAGK